MIPPTTNEADAFETQYKMNAKKFGVSTVKRLRLTSAQMLTLKTTPVTLVPAFLNSVIVVEWIMVKLNFNSIAYTGAGNMEFRYTNGSGQEAAINIGSGWWTGGATTYAFAPQYTLSYGGATLLNAPLVVAISSADPGAGNSTFDFYVKYQAVNF